VGPDTQADAAAGSFCLGKTDQSEDRRRGRDPPCSRDGQTGTHSATSR